MRETLRKSSFTGAAQFLLGTLIMAVAIPVFLHTKGPEAYGVFAVLMVVGNLNTFVAFGLNSALVKTLAEQGKTPESDRDIAVTFLLFLAGALPITALAAVFNRFAVVDIFGISPTFQDDARILFLFFLLTNLFLLVGQVFIAMLDAQQLVYRSNLLQMGYSTLYWGLVLVALLLHWPLAGIGCMVLIATVIWFVAAGIVAHRSWGKMALNGLLRGFLPSARKQLQYGSQIYLSSTIGFFYEPLTRILVSRYIGLAETGFLDIAFKLRNLAWGVLNRVLYPIFPLFSRLTDRSVIRGMIIDLEEKTMIIVVPVVAVVIAATHPLIGLWIGRDVDVIAFSAVAITSAYLVGSITISPYYQYLLAKGKPMYTVLIQVVNVGANAVIFLSFYGVMGYFAAVLSTVGAIVLSFAVTILMQRAEFGPQLFGSSKQRLMLLATLIAGASAGILLRWLLVSDLLRILIIPPVVSGISLLMFRWCGIVTPGDIRRYFGEDTFLSSRLEKILCRTS